jgi:6-phosphogluconolactonase
VTPNIVVSPGVAEAVRASAERVVAIAREAVASRGKFSLALAGGSTPKALYQLLAGDEFRAQIDWSKAHIFYGDERAVPTHHEYSNARMAREALLDHVPVPLANIEYMVADAPDLDASARAYEMQLRAVAGRLDLVLLGMGDDGHTASLFPGYDALGETERWCVATNISPTEPRLPRLTLTLPCINAAHNVLVLVTGEGKAQRVAQAMQQLQSSTRSDDALPIARVQPGDGELVWMLDEGAGRPIQNAHR